MEKVCRNSYPSWMNLFCMVLVFLLSVMFLYSIDIMLHRSVWLDEGMLLRNIVSNNDPFIYLKPLPYYDQAQPVVVSLFYFVGAKYLSLTAFALRLYAFVLMFLISMPILYVFREEKVNVLIPAFMILASLMSIGYYFTEIKHYGFEVASVFLMVFIYYLNNRGKVNAGLAVLCIALSALLGFSTMIPAFVFILFIIIDEFVRYGISFANRRLLLGLMMSVLILVLVYLNMKQLTVYQIVSSEIYKSSGFRTDLKKLYRILLEVHGVYVSVALVMAMVGALSGSRVSFLFRFSRIYLAVLFLVLLMKMLGLYPVAIGRHVVWVTSLSFVLVVLFAGEYVSSDSKIKNIISYIVLALLFVQGLDTVHKIYKKTLYVITDNDSLYRYLAEKKSISVFLCPYSQPTLEYYSKIIPGLDRHKYYGKRKVASGLIEENDTEMRFQKRVDESFNDLPSGTFYYLVTHMYPLYHEYPDASGKAIQRTIYVQKKFDELGCEHKEVFVSDKVQILEMKCSEEAMHQGKNNYHKDKM